MNAEKQELYKNKLLEKKARIIAELESLAIKSPIDGDYKTQYVNIGDDEEDNAQEQEVYERDILVENTLEDTLQLIDNALTRIEAGTYGRDIHTGELIDEARLDILPEAETAI
jgi:RNA polymerase-binding transcription factor DksA